MQMLTTGNLIGDMISSGMQTKDLKFLENQPSVRSISETDEYTSDEMHQFWLSSINIQELLITSSESFPGEMLKPSDENVILSASILNLMINYYKATYETLEF